MNQNLDFPPETGPKLAPNKKPPM